MIKGQRNSAGLDEAAKKVNAVPKSFQCRNHGARGPHLSSPMAGPRAECCARSAPNLLVSPRRRPISVAPQSLGRGGLDSTVNYIGWRGESRANGRSVGMLSRPLAAIFLFVFLGVLCPGSNSAPGAIIFPANNCTAPLGHFRPAHHLLGQKGLPPFDHRRALFYIGVPAIMVVEAAKTEDVLNAKSRIIRSALCLGEFRGGRAVLPFLHSHPMPLSRAARPSRMIFEHGALCFPPAIFTCSLHRISLSSATRYDSFFSPATLRGVLRQSTPMLDASNGLGRWRPGPFALPTRADADGGHFFLPMCWSARAHRPVLVAPRTFSARLFPQLAPGWFLEKAILGVLVRIKSLVIPALPSKSRTHQAACPGGFPE